MISAATAASARATRTPRWCGLLTGSAVAGLAYTASRLVGLAVAAVAVIVARAGLRAGAGRLTLGTGAAATGVALGTGAAATGVALVQCAFGLYLTPPTGGAGVAAS